MPDPVVTTGLPEGASDPSFDDIESLMSGQAVAPPVAEETKPPVVPPTESNPEAAAVETPATEPVQEQQTKPEEQTGETTPAEETTEGPEGKKDKTWIDKRMSSLAHKRREAEARERQALRDLEEERARRERLERELETARSGQPGPGQATEGKPSPATAKGPQFDKPKPTLKDYTASGGKNFKEGEEYEDAAQRHADDLQVWYDDKRTFDARQQAAQQADRSQVEAFQKDWSAAMETHPDFEDSNDFVLRNSSEGLQLAISNMARFSKEKAAWPDIVMHLADNPAELEDLNAQFAENQVAAIAELGRIRASLAPKKQKASPAPAQQQAQTAPKPEPKAAPKPPAAVGGGSAPAPVDLEDPNLSMNDFANALKGLL